MVKLSGGQNSINTSIFGLDEKKILGLLNDISFSEKGVTICFTGNRPSGLPWKYNERCDMFLEFRKNIKLFLELLIKKGATKFITGMAMGFDIIMAEVVLELKKDYLVELEGAIPCLNQASKWSYEYKKRYEALLARLDTTTIVSNMNYFDGCFHKRNHYMVDNADLVIAGSFMKSGGTVSTISYANKQGKPIIIFGN